MQAGATEVIPETMESSLMLASHLLHLLGVPMSKILRKVQEVRSPPLQPVAQRVPRPGCGAHRTPPTLSANSCTP